MIRKIAVYFFILSIWLIPTIIPFNEGFYNSLSIPNIILSNNSISLIWNLILINNATITYFLIKDYDLDNDFIFIIVLSYLGIFSFPLLFFIVNNLILSLISTIVVTISSYFFIIETKKINNNLYLFLIPNFIFGIYNLLLMITIYLLN